MHQEDRPTLQVGQPGGGAGDTGRMGESTAPAPPTYSTERFESPSAQGGTGQQTMMIGQPPPSFAWLAVLTGVHAGRLEKLNPLGTLIGRDAQSDVILDDQAASRQHAKVRREPGPRKNTEQYYIWDLGSSNGTFVNDKKIDRRTGLDDGDKIRIGETLLVFKNAESPPAAKPQAKKRAKRAKAKTTKGEG